MTSAPNLINTIRLQRVRYDRTKRSQVRQHRPQPITNRYMRSMQLSCSRSPEPFSRIMQTPNIQVSDLRTTWCWELAELSFIKVRKHRAVKFICLSTSGAGSVEDIWKLSESGKPRAGECHRDGHDRPFFTTQALPLRIGISNSSIKVLWSLLSAIAPRRLYNAVSPKSTALSLAGYAGAGFGDDIVGRISTQIQLQVIYSGILIESEKELWYGEEDEKCSMTASRPYITNYP